MNIFTYILSGALVLLGLVLLLFFARTLLEPCFGWFFQQRKSKGLSRLFSQLELFDQLVKDKKYPEAVRALENAMTCDIISGSELINQLKRHYQNILSRAVILADEKDIEIDYLAETEHLLLERIDLLLLNDNVSAAFSRVQSKREQLGKELPDWTREDFQKRLSEVKEELTENRSALLASFKRVVQSLLGSAEQDAEKKEDSITYH